MAHWKRFIYVVIALFSLQLTARAQETETFVHTIKQGETVYSIARTYQVSPESILKLNPTASTGIKAGETLTIPQQQNGTQEKRFHTIQAGETLYKLTKTYQVSADDICKANPGLTAENFKAGMVIRIPASTTPMNTPPAKETAQPQGVAQSGCREMHKVKRKETVFSISREYGITEAELIAANPELRGENKIKKGSFLCIPYPSSPSATQQDTPRQAAPSDSELFSENTKSSKRINVIKAAVVLPFLPDGASKSESAKMVEYYEGFLMAVDSLKRTGTSIDLYTYSTGPATSSLNSILGKSEMKDMDIIFGPLHQQHIKPLADFADKHDIRLVIPFTSKDNTVFRNPSVYQINTPQSYLYSEVYDHFVRQIPKRRRTSSRD